MTPDTLLFSVLAIVAGFILAFASEKTILDLSPYFSRNAHPWITDIIVFFYPPYAKRQAKIQNLLLVRIFGFFLILLGGVLFAGQVNSALRGY